MDDINLYPNDGEFYRPPSDQVKEADDEEREVLTALPQLEKIVAHFDARIAARDSIKSVAVDITENPELHQKICAVNDMVADALREERSLLQALLNEHIPN